MKRAFLPALAFLVACAAPAQDPPAAADAVRTTVETYLHGLKFNDVESLRKAFLPEAKLYFLRKDGSLGQLTQDQWYAGFQKNAGKEEPGRLEIAAVDVTGAAASVKVVEVYPGETYTDYLNLLRIAGEWKIVNKIYAVDKNKK